MTGFVERALAFFAEHGIAVKRLMTENGFSYVKNRSLRDCSRTTESPLDERALPAMPQRQGGRLRPADGAANGPTGSPTAHTTNVARHCHSGSTKTSGDGDTALDGIGHHKREKKRKD